jgi:hypothetical protein
MQVYGFWQSEFYWQVEVKVMPRRTSGMRVQEGAEPKRIREGKMRLQVEGLLLKVWVVRCQNLESYYYIFRDQGERSSKCVALFRWALQTIPAATKREHRGIQRKRIQLQEKRNTCEASQDLQVPQKSSTFFCPFAPIRARTAGTLTTCVKCAFIALQSSKKLDSDANRRFKNSPDQRLQRISLL